MQDWRAEPQIEAEHETRRAHNLDNLGQVGKGMEGLEADYYLAGATGKHFQRSSAVIRPGIHHEGTREAGVKLGELP